MNETRDDYIDLTEQIKNLWKSRNLILIFILLFSVSSLSISYLVPTKFMSYSVLNIAEQEQSNASIPSIDIPSFGGLAESAGLNLKSGATNLDNIVIETIKSKTFLNHLLSFDGISENLINNTLDSDSNYIEVHEKIYIKDLSATINKNTGLIFLSFKHSSPEFSRDFLQLIIDEVNNVFRENKLIELEKSREYFESEYEVARNTSIKTSISYLLEKNLNSEMLANVREEYVLESIEDPFVPEERHSPNRVIFLIVGAILGLVFGALIPIIRFNFLNQNTRE